MFRTLDSKNRGETDESDPRLPARRHAWGAAARFAGADYGYRQYYDTTWAYSTTYNYYYVTYYYQPVVTQTSYDYHYCIYYPSQPTYIYYYNPVSQVYWGRYEIGSKGDKRYSILADKDRKDLGRVTDPCT